MKDNFDLRKFLVENKLTSTSKLVKEATVVDKSALKVVKYDNYEKEMDKAGPNAEIFTLQDNTYVIDPNFKKYHSGTVEVIGLASEQGHEWENVEDYSNSIEGHENVFKSYPDNIDEIPNDVLRDEAMTYGEDYDQFFQDDDEEEETLKLDPDYDKGGKYYSEEGAEAFRIQPFKVNDIEYTIDQAVRQGKYIVGLKGVELNKFISDYMAAWEADKGDTPKGKTFK